MSMFLTSRKCSYVSLGGLKGSKMSRKSLCAAGFSALARSGFFSISSLEASRSEPASSEPKSKSSSALDDDEEEDEDDEDDDEEEAKKRSCCSASCA